MTIEMIRIVPKGDGVAAEAGKHRLLPDYRMPSVAELVDVLVEAFGDAHDAPDEENKWLADTDILLIETPDDEVREVRFAKTADAPPVARAA